MVVGFGALLLGAAYDGSPTYMVYTIRSTACGAVLFFSFFPHLAKPRVSFLYIALPDSVV